MFGRRSVAVARAQGNVPPVPAVAVRGLPASRNAVAYSPRPNVRVGAGGCGPQEAVMPAGSQQAWCYGMQQAGPIPLGAGIVAVPAAVGPVFGTATYTLLPVEGFTIEDIDIIEPSGQLLVSSIRAGRNEFLEAGAVSAQAFQSAKTLCKLARGFNIFPAVGLVFTFQNPMLVAVNVNVTATGYPIPCAQGLR